MSVSVIVPVSSPLFFGVNCTLKRQFWPGNNGETQLPAAVLKFPFDDVGNGSVQVRFIFP